jgi:hypothetical protein
MRFPIPSGRYTVLTFADKLRLVKQMITNYIQFYANPVSLNSYLGDYLILRLSYASPWAPHFAQKFTAEKPGHKIYFTTGKSGASADRPVEGNHTVGARVTVIGEAIWRNIQ